MTFQVAATLLYTSENEAVCKDFARGNQVDYRQHPCIFIAGLVQNKESVLHKIGMSHRNNIVALRSATGVGKLLDKPLSKQMNELLRVCFDRHTSALPPFFNTTWFSSRSFGHFMTGLC